MPLGRNAGFHLRVDGPRTGDDPPGVDDRLEDRLPRGGGFTREDDAPHTIRADHAAALGKRPRQLPRS